MTEFLKKIKLVDEFVIELPISRQEFNRKLADITDEGSTTGFAPFEALSSSPKQFKGKIFHDGFRIRRRRKVGQRKQNMVVIAGRLSENVGKLSIAVQVSPLKAFLYFFYGFLLVFYLVGFGIFLSGDSRPPLFVLPMLVIHGCAMVFLPYYAIRRRVANNRYDLEREFFYFTKNGI